MKALPENWNEMTHREKDLFFSRFYRKFTREGETDGLQDFAPEEIREAYQEFLKEEEQ